MSQLITTILSISSKEIIKLLTTTVSALQAFFCYKNNKQKLNTEKEEKTKYKKYCKDVDNVVDKGTIEDLLDLRR